MSPLLFAFQAARKSGVLLRGAVAALSALPRVSRSAGRLGRGCGDGAAARRRSGHRAPAARGCWAQRPRLGGGAGAGHQQPAAAQLLRAAPPRPGSTAEGGAPRRAAHRAGQRRERQTPRQTRLEPLISARASARVRRDRLNCRTPPRAFVERPSRRGCLQGLQPCRVYGSFSFFKSYSSAECCRPYVSSDDDIPWLFGGKTTSKVPKKKVASFFRPLRESRRNNISNMSGQVFLFPGPSGPQERRSWGDQPAT